MKNLRIKLIGAIIASFFTLTTLVYANPTLEMVAGTPNNDNQLDITVKIKGQTADEQKLLEASGTAFTLEFTEGITVVDVKSTFFDTFTAQFNSLTNPPDPSTYTVPVDYPSPLVTNNDGVSKTMVAAARCTPSSQSTDSNLMIITVEKTKAGTVTLKPTVLNNPSAGYNEDTAIDVLVGSDSEKEATDPDAYPVLIASTMAPIVLALDDVLDSDDDGLADSVETNTGVYVNENNTGTDPNNPDTDGDGMNDGDEVAAGRNPLVPEGDANGDGRVNIYDALTIAKLDALLITENEVPGLSVSDVNCDTRVNIYDALKIAKYDALMIPNLNCE